MAPMTLSRRRFVQGSCAVAAAASLRTALAPGAAFGTTDHTLVTIFLRGGMDGLSAVVPFADARYHDLRPNTAVPEASRLPLGDSGFGFHPALAPLYDLRGELAVVHSAGQPDGTRSHFDAQEFVDSGTPGRKGSTSGWLARHVQAVGASAAPLSVVSWGDSPTPALRSLRQAVAFDSLEDFSVNLPDDLEAAGMASLRALYGTDDLLGQRARTTLDAIDQVASLRGVIDPEAPSAYPDSQLGRGLREVALAIRSDVGLSAATLDVGGWDTHDDQGNVSEGGEMAPLLDDLGRSLAAFMGDLGPRRHRVTVVTLSEFGRRVEENGSNGTDHGRGTSMFVLGEGVRGGVYGDWVGLDDESLDRGDVPVTTDFRSILSEVLAHRVGDTDLAAVFPGFTPQPRGITVRA